MCVFGGQTVFLSGNKQLVFPHGSKESPCSQAADSKTNKRALWLVAFFLIVTDGMKRTREPGGELSLHHRKST